MTTRLVPADPSLTPAEDVAGALAVNPEIGLSAGEAALRLLRDGPNELRSRAPTPWWARVAGQLRDPLIYLLGLAIGVSLVVWSVEGARGAPVDALVIAAIVVANALIGLLQERKVEQAVAALAEMTAAAVTVRRDGRPLTIPVRELVVGDVLLVAEGDSVGADARVLSATDLLVQEAALTGESVPVEKSEVTLPEPAAVADRVNMLFRGTAVVRGVGQAVVTSTGMQTEVGSIADLLDKTVADPSPLQRELAAVSKALGAAVLVVAALVMAALAWVNKMDSPRDLETVLLVGVSLAVAAVPEGLPAVLSVVLAIGVRAMARQRAVVKSLPAVETLGSASVICSDKTGTLTCNQMTLTKATTPSGDYVRGVDGWDGPSDPRDDLSLVLLAAALANDAEIHDDPVERSAHGDPTEVALLAAALAESGVADELAGHTRVLEVPFTSDRKLMSAMTRDSGGRHRLWVKGAPDVLLDRCSSIRCAEGAVPLDAASRREALAVIDRLSRAAYRTLGVAYRDVATDRVTQASAEAWEADLTYLGVLGLIDPPRAEVPRAIADALRAGIRIVMITGDHPGTAVRIAEDLGIVTPGARALTGPDLDSLDDDELMKAVREVSVFARVAPVHKLRIVDALQADGHVVAMTGDGVNDAPALKSADIGVAMGLTGTEVTKQAGTMILGDDNFATIVGAVRQGRRVFDNIKKFLRYLLSSNLGEVFTVLLGVVLAGPLGLADATGPGTIVVPLLATQILWINLVTDSAPALALGVDPEIDDVMARPPRRQDQHILDARMWQRVLLVGAVTAAATLTAIDAFLPGGLIPGGTDLATARTAGFTTLVLAQLVNAFCSRSELRSSLAGLAANRWLLAAVALALVLQVLVVQWAPLQHAFATTSLTAQQWALCSGLAMAVLVAVELDKVVRRVVGVVAASRPALLRPWR